MLDVKTDQEIQQIAEAHWSLCAEVFYGEEEGVPEDQLPESPAFAPYCGCDTCVVREILMAAAPHVADRALVEAIEAIESEADKHLNPEDSHARGYLVGLRSAVETVRALLTGGRDDALAPVIPISQN